MAKKRITASQDQIEGEIWKDIFGFEGYYQVSSMGRIKSLKYQGGPRIMRGGSAWGYKNIKLTINYVNTYFRVHKLVALAFLPNPDNKLEINHKNGIKHDNRLENLEWATRSENAQHSYDTGLQKPPHTGRTGALHPSSKLILDTQTGVFYGTKKEAAFAKGINNTYLSSMLTGKCKNKTSLIYA